MVEQRVIQTLGLELAQSRVDNAFLSARLAGVKDTLDQIATAIPPLDVDPPVDFSFVPTDLLLTLQKLLA